MIDGEVYAGQENPYHVGLHQFFKGRSRGVVKMVRGDHGHLGSKIGTAYIGIGPCMDLGPKAVTKPCFQYFPTFLGGVMSVVAPDIAKVRKLSLRNGGYHLFFEKFHVGFFGDILGPAVSP